MNALTYRRRGAFRSSIKRWLSAWYSWPSCKVERREILEALARGGGAMDPGVDLDDVAQRTEGFSGADIRALVADAALSAIHRAIEDSEQTVNGKGGGGGGGGGGAPAVTRSDMAKAMSEVGRYKLKQIETRVETAWCQLLKLIYDYSL